MFFVVFGILQAGTNNALFAGFLVLGLGLLIGFFFYFRARERRGKEALLSTRLFRNRTCNLALVTQNIQWLMLMGVSFTVSVFLQGGAWVQRDRDRRCLHRRDGRRPGSHPSPRNDSRGSSRSGL